MNEKIRTLKDALAWSGASEEDYRRMAGELPREVRAFIALRFVARALNEGWTPGFGQGEVRYYVAYDFIDDASYGRLTAELKGEWPVEATYDAKRHRARPRIYQEFAPLSDVSLGRCEYPAVLAFREKETALYAARQFAELFVCLFTRAGLTWQGIPCRGEGTLGRR